MKTRLFIFFSFVLITINSYGQNWSSTLPDGAYISKVKAYGSNMYAATNRGKIFFSSNSGLNWTRLNDTTGVGFISDLASGGGVLLLGAYSKISYSNNNGSSWASYTPPVTCKNLLYQSGFFYMGTVGAGVYRSSDGLSWTPVNTGISTLNINCISGDGISLVVGTGSQVAISVNGGTSWNLYAGPPFMSTIQSVAISGANVLATDGSSFYQSTDSGFSFTEPTITGSYLGVDLMAYNGTDVVVRLVHMGGYHTTHISHDSGSNWVSYSGNYDDYMTDISMSSSSIIFGSSINQVATGNPAQNFAVKTNNGINDLDIYDIKKYGNYLVAPVSNAGLAYSTNGGSTWYSDIIQPYSSSGPSYVTALSYGNAGSNYFVTTDYDGFNLWGIYKSNSPAGGLWNPVSALPQDRYNKFTQTSKGTFVCSDSVQKILYYSSDNGNNWATVTAFNDSIIKQIECGTDYAYVLTGAGVVYKSMNPGTGPWTQVYNLGAANAPSMFAYKSKLVVASQVEYKFSSNSGNSFQSVITPFGNGVHKFYLKDSTLLAVPINSGSLFQSNNYGLTWVDISGNFSAVCKKKIDCLLASHDTIWAGVVGYGAYLVDAGGTINGTVYHGSSPVNGGWVKLFHMHHNKISRIMDSVLVNTGGNFQFTNVFPGNYIIRAEYGTVLPGVLKTYCDSTAYWDSSTVIHVTAYSTTSQNVYLLDTLSGTGSGSFSGTLYEGNGFGAKLLSPGSTVGGIDVGVRKKPSGRTAMVTQTDGSGQYVFNNIAPGNYDIVVDIPGLPMDSTYNFTITANESFSNQDFFIDSEKVYINTTTNIQSATLHDYQNKYLIYPNPGNGIVNIKNTSGGAQGNNTDVIIKCYTMFAEKIFEEKVKIKNVKQIDLSNLSPGVYILQIETDAEPQTLRIIITK